MTLTISPWEQIRAARKHYQQQAALVREEVGLLELEADEAEEHVRVLRDRVLTLRAKWLRLVDEWVATDYQPCEEVDCKARPHWLVVQSHDFSGTTR